MADVITARLGERHYHPGYYAAFVLDPQGNNIEAVYHGKAERSAGSVAISFTQ
ncbi:Lactoylglutathione lyase [Klebsiella pneumoniae]|uniref:Lactoylglutathione lyase n=1 Tax=Klebsiella pneumoniae TaxID=573 RepID=A0A3S4I229_KLEPN|nr:Lactoylglutathione lyase [Klebsiella pneumoniae]